ncbi:MAG TPA: DUF378 domain-containing protein [Clostridia bacterium]|nr:DUF378 domain-containing protein [Clostridia bacterium]
MKRGFNIVSIIALILIIIGALNWLLVGIFDFNLVGWITGSMIWLETAIYILVGIAGIFMIAWLFVRKFDMVSNRNDDIF